MNSTWAALDRFHSAELIAELVLVFFLASSGPFARAETAPQQRFGIQPNGQGLWLTQPNGDRFFSLGVCCVNQGASRTNWNSANPEYAAWRQYGDSNAWAAATLGRLKAWGFTTLAGWSDFETLRHCRGMDMAIAPVLHMGATAGAPWWDMWDPKVVERLDRVAREGILAFRGDSRVIGYYTDNETGWWNAILFKMTLEQAASSGQRQRLIKLLRETYHNDWVALMQDFESAPILESWEELEQHGMLYLRPGGNGIRVERQFLSILAERYYSLVHDAVRRYDPGALILGDRFPSFYYPEVVRACAPYVDVVSCNLSAAWNDGSFPRCQLETLHALSNKPIMIGEFYMVARENHSGNKNNHGVYPIVDTQKERATGFRRTLLSLVKTPYVIGADWFQYYDQPTHGRYDGENFNFGLVDINNQPYGPLTSTSAALDLVRLRLQPAQVRPDADGGIPRAPRDPLGHFEPGLALIQWDRERGFVRPSSEFPLADLYVCWNRQAIYLGLCAQDVVEDTFYRGKTVLASERAGWIVSVSGSNQPIQGRLGAGMEAVFDGPMVRGVSVSGINGNTRSMAALELPAKLFGKKQLRRGDAIEFSSTFFTHCRAYSVEWNGTFRLD
jgi:hypothetical protein